MYDTIECSIMLISVKHVFYILHGDKLIEPGQINITKYIIWQILMQNRLFKNCFSNKTNVPDLTDIHHWSNHDLICQL